MLDRKRDEYVGHRATMTAMTTATVVYCPYIPSGGLKQSMIDYTIPLDVKHIYRDCGNRPYANEMSHYLIANAVRSLFPTAVDKIFKDSSVQFPEMTVIEQIKPEKTRFWQLGAIYEDEGSIAGTYGVHDSIFIKQLGLCTPAQQSMVTSIVYILYC
jgi:hypothetical protein